MIDVFVTGRTLPEVYHKGIIELSSKGQLADCQDWNLKEKKEGYSQRECRMTLHIDEPLGEPRISKLGPYGPLELEQYRLEILEGILDFAVDAGIEDYTYHKRMIEPIDQIQFVIDDLKRNKEMSSRRAAMSIRDNAKDSQLENPACLQNVQCLVREGKLDMCVLFRSNDFAQAFFMNAFGLICFQEKIANDIGVPVGTYSQTSNSMHVYEVNYDTFDGYVRRIENEPIEDITFNYEGEGGWKEMMDAETDDIRTTFQKKAASYGIG